MTPTVFRQAIFRGALAIPLAFLLTGAAHGGAGETKQHGSSTTHYLILELPGIDGAQSVGNSINNLGIVTGWSDVPDEGTRHAMLWFLGLPLDLGTLGGPNSTVTWPQSNPGGMVVGFSETAEMDPREEDWSCSAFFPGDPTHQVCRGFAWILGRMKTMPTLGGTHSVAVGANGRGQVVGWAETDFEDPTCGPDRNQQLQFLPVVWKPRTGEIQSLPPFGDCPEGPCSTGTANSINNKGQIVGISGECDQAVGRASARYIVMWEDGVPKDLGNIGGDHWNTPTAINDQGQVVGFANVIPGPGFNAQGFLWTEEDGIHKLDPLEGDVQSQAWGINEHGQVAGLSRGADGDTAVLWQDGEIIDLNDRVAFGYDKHLALADDINDLGIITGNAVDPDTGESIAFWAIPLSGRDDAGGE